LSSNANECKPLRRGRDAVGGGEQAGAPGRAVRVVGIETEVESAHGVSA